VQMAAKTNAVIQMTRFMGATISPARAEVKDF
jgi:hypothetical protein